MYHHHSQQQEPQPFSHGPRPHHQSHPNQHQNRSPSDMLSQVLGFQFPRPTQLPDELESALAIRGTRDMDHRLIDHMNPPNQHQNQGSGSGISQHGNYSSNSVLTSDNQPGQQQGVDWSSYQPPTKLFASAPPGASHQSQRLHGPQQQPESSLAGSSIPSWTAPVGDSVSPQAQHPHGGRSGGGGDGQGLYTPESAGSILASFGLSNEDLEVLSHYPDDQLTPDTLPFILRDIQINKSGSQKTAVSTSSPTFSQSHGKPLPPSHTSPLAHSSSQEVPSLLTVTQTAGKVIDYGHSSRAKEESCTTETFRREPLSSERTVKMYPASLSSSLPAKAEKAERRQIHLEHTEPSKHGDWDYRKTSGDHRKSTRSTESELPASSKSRNLDRDYRHDGPSQRPSSETRSEDSSRRSLSSSSGSKTHISSKKLPTPTMISDFSAVSPKVYPHTCSLCHTQCDQEKDWVDHINTVNHTAACRDLRNKYPDWKPNLPSRSGRYGSRALWDPKDQSPSYSMSRSLACSPTASPPHSKHRGGPHPHRPHGKHYPSHHHSRYHPYPAHGHQLEQRSSGSHSPSRPHRPASSSKEHRPEKRGRESSGGSSHSRMKPPHHASPKCSIGTSQHPSFYKAGHSLKHGLSQSSTKNVKSGVKTGGKTGAKTLSAKADASAKPPPAKKKKKMIHSFSQDSSVADHLVYLTGIPNDASEQEVTHLVGSFGKINNVILMPCSEEDSEKGEGQKASVCMVKTEDAQALANATNLSIKEFGIIASTAKKPERGQSSDVNSSKSASEVEKAAPGEDSGSEAEQKTSDEKGTVLITGLPESSWSESDIIKLIQPFGTPSDIILATHIRKVLVSVPEEIAEEIVKVHTFVPAKMKDSELKIIHVKQRIGLSTPVALYNLLMATEDTPVPIGWSSLLVISNVPNTPSGSSEVQKLVRRFGTVIKTLVLNNMVICEMATAAMALSVYKRFQMFPCIIQNNPLFFSRKPDPKANTQTKVITAYLDSSEDTPTNGKGGQTAAAADEEETAHEKMFECPLEGAEKVAVGTDEEMSKRKTFGGDKALGGNGRKDEALASAVCHCSAAQDTKPGTELETSAAETVMETPEEKNRVYASEAGNDKTTAGSETKPSSCDVSPEAPKVTRAMASALLVECPTRTPVHPEDAAASISGEEEETGTEREQEQKSAEETKKMAKDHTDEMKKQERERKDKIREKRTWEKDERAKRERQWDERAWRKREEERREWERKERERRERKRVYDDGLLGSRSSCRCEGYKQSSWRDAQSNNSEPDNKTEEEEEEFPFNMSDFVTVDAVGDVTNLPCSSPVAPMETTTEAKDAPISVPQEAPGGTAKEGSIEMPMSDTAVTLVKSEEQASVCEPMSASAAESSVSSGVVAAAAPPSPASHADCSTSHTQMQAPDTEPSSIDTSSNSPAAAGAVTAAEHEEDETEHDPLSRSQAEEEVAISDRTEPPESRPDHENKETAAPSSQLGKQQSTDQTNTEEEESVKKEFQTNNPTSTDHSLPPFDPSNPIGMEFLVPKTGFFCKACNRFFSGTKETELSHCKTVRHYENLKKYLQTTKPLNVAAKPAIS